MKDKPLVIIITLLGGAVSSICCILKGVGLLWTLLTTLICLFIFMIVGLCVNRVYAQIKSEVDAVEAEKKRLEEEEQRRIMIEEEKRKEWQQFHPDEPYPENLEELLSDEMQDIDGIGNMDTGEGV